MTTGGAGCVRAAAEGITSSSNDDVAAPEVTATEAAAVATLAETVAAAGEVAAAVADAVIVFVRREFNQDLKREIRNTHTHTRTHQTWKHKHKCS
jgi:hypothetical protein